jgi:hypothetical protein
LTVWIDTLQQNVCGAKNFQIPIHVSELYFSDSVVGFTLTVYYDRSTLDFDNLVVTPSGTIARTANLIQVSKDPENGVLFIQAADTTLKRFMAGKGPLLYLVGTITAPDTISGLYGWVQVHSLVFESLPVFDTVVTYNSGFVHVVRDTTPAYTGHLSVTAGSFDTLRIDTIDVKVENLKGRKVNEITFGLKSAPGYYSFLDTLQSATLAGEVAWTVKEVTITPDSIKGRFVSQTAIASDGTLLRIRVQRQSDSAFSKPLTVTSFDVNHESCLGKLVMAGGEVTAAEITKPPVSEVEEGGAERDRLTIVPDASDGSIVIVAQNFDIQEIRLFDRTGSQIGNWFPESSGRSAFRIRTPQAMASGVYFMMLRSRNEIMYKQFSVIK